MRTETFFLAKRLLKDFCICSLVAMVRSAESSRRSPAVMESLCGSIWRFAILLQFELPQFGPSYRLQEAAQQGGFMSFESPGNPGGSTPPPPETPYTQVPYQQVPSGYGPPGIPQAGLTNNVAASIAYITFIPAVVFLALSPYNRDPLVRFHSFQSIFLSVASIVIHFGLSFVLHVIPFLGVFLAAGLSVLVSLVFFVVWLIAIVQAFQGKYWKVPILGDLAMQQAGSAPVL